MTTARNWSTILFWAVLAAGCGYPQGNRGLLREYAPLPGVSSAATVRRPVVPQAIPPDANELAAPPSWSSILGETPRSVTSSSGNMASDNATLTVIGPTRCQVRLSGERLGRVPINAYTVFPGRYELVIRCGQRRTKQATELRSGEEVTWRIRRRGRRGLRLVRSG